MESLRQGSVRGKQARPARRLALLALTLAACGSPQPGSQSLGTERRLTRRPEAHPAPSSEQVELAKLEGAQSLGEGRLLQLLRMGPVPQRERAALALSRMPLPKAGASATLALCEALDGPDSEVAAMAAFALGQRADPSSAGALSAHLNNPVAHVRAEVVSAASKLGALPCMRSGVLQALGDPSDEVVVQALIGTTRWPREQADAGQVDAELLAVLGPFFRPIAGTPTSHAEVVWHALFALQRRQSVKARGAFLEFCGSSRALERLFSLRGLKQLPSDPASLGALQRGLSDPDWRVALEAAEGLGTHASPGSVVHLLKIRAHPSSHVRAAVLRSLASCAGRLGPELRAALGAGRYDDSAAVRASALAALATLSTPPEAAALLSKGAADPSWPVRQSAATAAGELPPSLGLPILELLSKDPDLSVAGSALRALGGLSDARAHMLLTDHLTHSDNGMRLAAVEALSGGLASLGADERAALVPSLLLGLNDARGDISDELTYNALRLLGEVGGASAVEALREARAHPNPFVVQVASEALTALSPGAVEPDLPPRQIPTHEVPLPGRDYSLESANPRLLVQTTRGPMLFELFPAEAPVHVYNVLRLARDGHYDGLRFHRVVPDFVIQGGDYRGDGNGQASWRGGALAREFSPRRYIRGSLGMPRNEDPDSGGSQLFVTQRPTPHLDGRYTILGELRDGFDVLDAIEIGDGILEVRELP